MMLCVICSYFDIVQYIKYVILEINIAALKQSFTKKTMNYLYSSLNISRA